ncbi:TonB-dependent siderophore receptor [Phyllobacterium phragmitis]|uniref:TonB-dependent siderophore receptor n=1 Tax=Phyllobacterium phragmitis TaxID=2670329 RepID=A0A2S9IWG8_9HYPH|nr:TonB-dependent siderophore receptor [Phyllobacterium phragmitis]PRD44830.1 TonB-dependent siderophore receptor [Phyllobacterium phragmitis]
MSSQSSISRKAVDRIFLPQPSIRHEILLAGVGFLSLSSGVAFGQGVSDDPSTEILLDPITITATDQRGDVGPDLDRKSNAGSRLGLTARQTPASVEIIDGETIRQRGQMDVNQAIVRNGIGINFMGSPGNGGTSLGMRGFTGHGSVTRLYDGVKLYPGSGTITFPFDSWTVGRIEILHGPASVLYGEGAIGGAINIVPKKPLTDRSRNEIRTMIGTDGQKGIAIGSAGPIDERFAYTLDISGKGSDGWMERGDASSLAVSGALRWQANDELALTFSHDHGYNKPSAYFGTPLIEGRLDERLRRENYNVTDSLVRFRDHLTQLKAEWTPNETLSINSTTYYLSSDRDWRNVESYLYRPQTRDILRDSYIAINHRHEQVGNRTDLTFESRFAGMENRTVVGFDVNHIRFSNSNNSPYSGQSVVDPIDFDPGHFISPDPFRTTLDSTTLQYSLFADNRLAINDQWSVVAGFRYDDPRLKRTNPQTGARFSRDLDSFNWRIGAVYTPVPDLAFFAQYSQASEPIGSMLSLSDAQRDYALPRGEQYEAGVKFSFLDGRADATLSAYHIRKKDVLARDPDNPTIIRQIGLQSSQGIEVALGLDIGDEWRVEANGTILSAQFDDYLQAGGDFSSNTPPNVPRQAANLFASWAFAEDWQVFGGLHYAGQVYTDDANTKTRPSYLTVDAGLQWRPTETATIELNVYNLFDEIYATSGGATQWLVAPPRSATLSARFTF